MNVTIKNGLFWLSEFARIDVCHLQYPTYRISDQTDGRNWNKGMFTLEKYYRDSGATEPFRI